MKLFIDGNPIGLFEQLAHDGTWLDTGFEKIIRFDNGILLADPINRCLQRLNLGFMVMKKGDALAGVEMSAENLQRERSKGVGVKVGPLGFLNRTIELDELFGVEEEGHKLLVVVRELEPFAQGELIGESRFGEKGKKRGDDGGVCGVVVSGSKAVLDFCGRNGVERGKDGAEEAEFVELDQHGAELAKVMSFGELLPYSFNGHSGK